MDGAQGVVEEGPEVRKCYTPQKSVSNLCSHGRERCQSVDVLPKKILCPGNVDVGGRAKGKPTIIYTITDLMVSTDVGSACEAETHGMHYLLFTDTRPCMKLCSATNITKAIEEVEWLCIQ